ncbi:MAG: GNAT family N-acetyltransferase [Bacilli bacterium]|nr:GNAT family N-acetyltransferase [Bacilli bacterium]
MEFLIKKEIEVSDFMEIRKDLNWNAISPVLVERAIKGSMINISVFENEKCIGIGRIVGDGALKGMLTDIMVLKEYQNKGVGKLIVTSLIKELEDRVNDGDCFQLEASPTANNRDFYIKCGLKYKPENQDGVYLWIRK